MSEIITFGSSTVDIFLKPEKASFDWGEKVQAGGWQMETGGGGANAAVSFALQGFKTAYCGKVGDDIFGKTIANNLKNKGVGLDLLVEDEKRKTALSFVLSSGNGAKQANDRIIFLAEGACHFLAENEIKWQALKKAKLFYIAPLYEKSADLLEPLIMFAREHHEDRDSSENKIKIALNPSVYQIKNKIHQLRHLIAKTDILILNLDEAAMLTDLPAGEEGLIIDKIQNMGVDTIAITKGEEGALVAQDKHIYKVDIFPTKVAERTGAGDAFGSGFVAGLLEKNNIEYAIRLAMANSASCLGQIGAQNGLLKRGEVNNFPNLTIRQYEN